MNPDQTVSVIIPARNEEHTIGQAVLSLASQPEVSEIVVVDDQSTDDTAPVLEALAAEVPKLRALEGGPLPEGWVGKNHAAWQGAQRATGDWLLFTDADALHLQGFDRARAASGRGQRRRNACLSRRPRKCTPGGSAP